MANEYGIDVGAFDYLAGGAQQAQTEALNAQANASNLAAAGTTAQIVGFDSGGSPQAKSVAGDSNGVGLAFSGDTLTATLSQGIKTSDSPTFSALTITNLATVGDLKVDTSGTTIKRISYGTVSADPGSIASITRGSVDVTVTGVTTGDIVIMNPPDGLNTGLVYGGCRVTAANTVRIYLANLTAGAIDDGSNTWDYLWIDLT